MAALAAIKNNSFMIRLSRRGGYERMGVSQASTAKVLITYRGQSSNKNPRLYLRCFALYKKIISRMSHVFFEYHVSLPDRSLNDMWFTWPGYQEWQDGCFEDQNSRLFAAKQFTCESPISNVPLKNSSLPGVNMIKEWSNIKRRLGSSDGWIDKDWQTGMTTRLPPEVRIQTRRTTKEDQHFVRHWAHELLQDVELKLHGPRLTDGRVLFWLSRCQFIL